MNGVGRAVKALAAEIADLSAAVGTRVTLDPARVLDRSDALDLASPGLWSPNRTCRLVRAADGWIAVNLPRPTDLELIPAWTGGALEADPWGAILTHARARPCRDLVEDARLLGLAVAAVGEVAAPDWRAPVRRMAASAARKPRVIRVLDLSSLWAGPLCGAILAEAGCAVTKLESLGRADGARATPAFFRRLNGAKREATLDFAAPDGPARLAEAVAVADVVITSARPRAFQALGVTPEAAFAANPGLVWVAITGYGWTGPDADRVAFGDDAAAAGGLVRSTGGGPCFIGDALADPLTGLAAAAGALKTLAEGGGAMIDAALARTAAGVAKAAPVAS